jgi:hypothetical protein
MQVDTKGRHDFKDCLVPATCCLEKVASQSEESRPNEKCHGERK